jgi:NAD(P)H-hydrate repair Nnr-like enzyme with NAD(P)H-hydrate dehydratase domain
MANPSIVLVTSVPRLPPRAIDSHKGTFGKVLLITGSLGMSGAGVLSGTGALRGGAGLVQVAAPETVVPIIAAGNPCYMTVAPSGNRIAGVGRGGRTGVGAERGRDGRGSRSGGGG